MSMYMCVCAMGCARNSMADPGVFGDDCSCWCHDRKPANPYEAARERLERAVNGLRAAKKDRDEAEAYLLKAEAEWAGATRDLRQYETTPGIPLPEYREQVTR